MSAATTILFRIRPTSTITTTGNSSTTHAFLPKLNSPKTVSSLQFPPSKSGEFVSQYKRGWSPNTMSGSTPTCALGDNSIGDEGAAAAFEHESFINEFRPNSTAEGLEATLNRLSKWIVAGLFGAVLICRHDAEALWAAIGSVLNTGLSTMLKRVLNQERPVSNLRSDPGMPSSHAQSIFFTVIFVVVSMLQWLGANGLAITLSGLALAFGSYLSWLRVSQQLHTISQVVVGAVLGSAFSILWFWSWDAIVLKAFISYLWVRIVVVLGATIFCVGFLIHVVQHWFKDR
ncbi:lipid phosphate phosphatase epsilon 1, chloroplastic isoform X1 [Rhododendron vialii]|uniref:lipid phosphate phosphatase epsilon 1, chloroplastic isoform X1 n=1 Tax=Rhododendron vialii TaxID=182163 RepID=UPI00265D7F94|nr:lipid phosphate phosphatase epsilon 1, chloroplastic isoform X1 [Rhododendron vialii]